MSESQRKTARKVLIDGVEYHSVFHAAHSLGLTKDQIRYKIETKKPNCKYI